MSKICLENAHTTLHERYPFHFHSTAHSMTKCETIELLAARASMHYHRNRNQTLCYTKCAQYTHTMEKRKLMRLQLKIGSRFSEKNDKNLYHYDWLMCFYQDDFEHSVEMSDEKSCWLNDVINEQKYARIPKRNNTAWLKWYQFTV